MLWKSQICIFKDQDSMATETLKDKKEKTEA